jgi:hypothetical protein
LLGEGEQMRSLQSPLISYHCAFPWQDSVAHAYSYEEKGVFVVRMSEDLFRDDIVLSSEEATLRDAIDAVDKLVRTQAWLPQRDVDDILRIAKIIHEVDGHA